MWSGFQVNKLNTHREFDLKLAANCIQPENQTELVPGPDPAKIKNVKKFFQQIKPKPLLVQHVKVQPAASIFVWEKGGVTCETNRGTPCIFLEGNNFMLILTALNYFDFMF